MTFTDLNLEQGEDGIFDITLDGNTKDLAVSYGMRVPLAITFFTDRRARSDEVGNPEERRGWSGDLFSSVPGDSIGSGLWLYDQSRLTLGIIASLRLEAISSCSWLLQEQLAKSIDADIKKDPEKRAVKLDAFVTDQQGGTTSHSFYLWSETQSEVLARL